MAINKDKIGNFCTPYNSSHSNKPAYLQTGSGPQYTGQVIAHIDHPAVLLSLRQRGKTQTF